MTEHRGRPNILVVMADQLKATALPGYGNPIVRTPALDQLAASGVRYDLAFTPHPLCVPARVSLWTGAYPHDHGVRTNELRMPAGTDNYLRRFHDVGYRTALFGKDHCFGPDDTKLFDERVEFLHRGREDGEDDRDRAFSEWVRDDGRFTRLWDAHPTPLPAESCPAGRITNETCQFIETDDQRPFLAWVSFPEPHEPYYAPQPFASWYDPQQITLPPKETGDLASKPRRQQLYRELCGFDDVDELDLRKAVAMYYAMVSFVDACVGRILNALRASGRDRDTIVVFTADHGDFSGEHGLVVKCGAFYDCLMRVPLFLSWPEHLPADISAPELVSSIDIMPTLAALADVHPPAVSRGRPLPHAGLPTSGRDAVFGEYGAGARHIRTDEAAKHRNSTNEALRPLLRAAEAEGRAKMVRTLRWKYTYDPLDPIDELYDLHSDPWELTNLARDPDHADVVIELRHRLLNWSIGTEDAAPLPLFFDEHTLEHTSASHLPKRSD